MRIVGWDWSSYYWRAYAGVSAVLLDRWRSTTRRGLADARLIERYGKYLLITRKDIDRADTWFATRGEITILIGRLIPGVRHFISIPAGVSRMSVPRFTIFTFIGAFPWSLALAWAGYVLGQNFEEIREFTRPFVLPVVIIVFLAALWFIRGRILEIREESHQQRREEELN